MSLWTLSHGTVSLPKKAAEECCRENWIEDGKRYKIIWMFPAVKGEEPKDESWPWADKSFICRILNGGDA